MDYIDDAIFIHSPVFFVFFIKTSYYLLATIRANGRVHLRGCRRPYTRMDASKRMRMQLKIIGTVGTFCCIYSCKLCVVGGIDIGFFVL